MSRPAGAVRPGARPVTLELATFTVDEVVVGNTDCYRDGRLEVDARALRALVRDVSDAFEDVAVNVVRPGDDARIIHAIDVVEPRARLAEPGSDFPGLLGRQATVGSGRTHRLGGLVVTTAGEPAPGEPTYWREAVVDASGPGAIYSPLSSLTHLVVTLKPDPRAFPDHDPAESLDVFQGTAAAIAYNRAARIAGLRVATYLAALTRDQQPDAVACYELSPVASRRDLPRVVYLFQMTCPYFYGQLWPREGSVGGTAPPPTLIHPNEVLDGALVNAYAMIACIRDCTYFLQTHAVIEELYRRHGTELDFRGVVIYTNGDSIASKGRIVNHAVSLAHLLGAEGAVLNYQGGGNPEVDVMLACQQLEARGIRTALLLPELGGGQGDSPFIHFVPEADAIVSLGSYEQTVQLGPVARVVGGARLLEGDEDASGPLQLSLRYLLGATIPYGQHVLRGVEY